MLITIHLNVWLGPKEALGPRHGEVRRAHLMLNAALGASMGLHAPRSVIVDERHLKSFTYLKPLKANAAYCIGQHQDASTARCVNVCQWSPQNELEAALLRSTLGRSDLLCVDWEKSLLHYYLTLQLFQVPDGRVNELVWAPALGDFDLARFDSSLFWWVSQTCATAAYRNFSW